MATLIRTDGSTTPVSLSPPDTPVGSDPSWQLAALQALVGGDIQVLRLPGEAYLVLDEDGKGRGKPVNHTATALTRGVLAPGDWIVGDVVVCRVTGAGTDAEHWI